ncbi:helix-turn-helix transcriptional regulator [Sphingosinicella microcystinivorans]|uniref:helix-turn-helix transcriptional regulator n=1 Tax=Sphingosinicella microcystinivorans TaxID=335406 RepID=UPI001FB0DD1F|nr:AraC family transcriptional regulator [Sphingosinicella microcystinivorans]
MEENPDGSVVSTLLRPSSKLIGTRQQFSSDFEAGSCGVIRLSDDLFVLNTNVSFTKGALAAVTGQDFIELHFRLSGRLSLYPEIPGNETVDVDKGALLVWRQPEGMNVMERLEANEPESSMTIYLRPSALERYFGDYTATLPSAVATGLAPQGNGLFFLRMACYPKLIELVRELWSLGIETGRDLVRGEALVMMVLCEIMSMLEDAHNDSTNICRLSDIDVRCLRKAREHICSQYTPPPTIDELAKAVGLSATKLKSGFKALFGKSISQFANELRMQHALDLLRKSDNSILFVAEALGYEYQNSFTVAFRRHFKILPKDYKRDPLILSHRR